MEMTHNEIEKLKKEIKDEILQIVVTKDDCNDVQTNINNRFSNDDKRLDRQETFNSSLKKFLWLGLGAIIGETVISLINLLKNI